MGGERPRLLLLPGWNTPASSIQATLPAWFRAQWSCQVHEWPGLGSRCQEDLPPDMEALVQEVRHALSPGSFVGVIGFCLGGVVAWEHARIGPGKPPPLFLVESPYHFPLVLAPLLVPGIGPWIFQFFTRSALGRSWVERGLFGRSPVPSGFWAAFGRSGAEVAAQGYLRILARYERQLGPEPRQPGCPCHRIVGARAPRLLSWARRRHAIHAREHKLEGVGHFPASEDPESLYRMIARLLGN